MRAKPLVVTAFVGIVMAASCGAPTATVEDFVLDGRAELLTVDGQPVRRASSKYVTVVPVALVEPGNHTFRVRLRADERGAPEETLIVSATLSAGKGYRLEIRGRAVQFVERRAEE
jgi:hypothetical protein